jgi:hypothetical protein
MGGVGMFDLSKAYTFEEYVNNSTEEKRKIQMEALKKTILSDNAKKKISEINREINMVVFSETYCPDCVVTLPFIKRIEELNSKIKMYIMPLKGNEAVLDEYVGEKRIPTVMVFDSKMEPLGVYIEIPAALKEKMSGLSEDEIRSVIADYRQGKYNELIEAELLDIITR